MKIRVGSRESKLAVVQSEMVMQNITENYPDIKTVLVTMKTTGDIILDRTLDKIGGKGLFVKELDKALMDEKVDLTVHSFKDMPMEESEQLPIIAVSKREDPRDVLILPKGVTLEEFLKFNHTKPVGCSSLRRKLQLEMLYDGIEIAPIRGNVISRIQKLDDGEFSAIILAYAGIKRLGLEDRISKIFSVSQILPAACQGVLAVQSRKGFDTQCLSGFHDEDTYYITKAERSFVRTLDGGCSSPVASYGEINKDELTLTGLYVDKDNIVHKKTVTGDKKTGEQMGYTLAKEMACGKIEELVK